ncbi:MAG: hypothetical protein HOC74_06595 [Gemmatimonadetes bacterium]|nr:hypothetical protein [Gemmatimonadota bacterium]
MDDARVVADGASFLPEVLGVEGVPMDHAAFINVATETRGARWRAQRTDERKEYLSQYEDPSTAWETWMERDEILAKRIATEATRLGMLVVNADSGMGHEDVVNTVADHFGWKASMTTSFLCGIPIRTLPEIVCFLALSHPPISPIF